jgi:hypothetical protein
MPGAYIYCRLDLFQVASRCSRLHGFHSGSQSHIDMHEVTCFHCGHVANISPDADRCPVCTTDLKHLIPPDDASRYFYERAAEMAAAGEITLALLEVERGLAYHPSSELHLLAALLSQRLGNLPQMRQHVAAIAVDDILRPEAEWLLRSHQVDMGALRQGAKKRTASSKLVSHEPAPPVWSPAMQEPPLPQQQAATRGAMPRINSALYGAIALALVVFTVWVGIGSGADVLFEWFAAPPAAIADPPTPAPATSPAGAMPTVVITATTSPPANTPEIPPNLVDSQNAQDLLAASTPNQMMDALENQGYDIGAYLATTNRPELADLEVAATLRDGKLKLQGVVQLFDHRQSIIDLAQRAPGVTEVDAIDLLLRQPPTYTVAAGDTLWVISYKLYGDNRVDQLYAANRDVLSSPERLSVGQVLKVPAAE